MSGPEHRRERRPGEGPLELSARDHPARRGTEADLDLRAQLQALVRFWRSAALATVLGVTLSVAYSVTARPIYEATATFFATSSVETSSSALQADEFAQRRINSYVGVVNSERIAKLVIDKTDIDLSPIEVSRRIEASVDPETVLLNVRVLDPSPSRALEIATALTEHLGDAVAQIDSGATNVSGVQLNVISGPTLTPYAVSPRTKLNVALGLLLGLGLGVAQAVVRHQLDHSVRDGHELALRSGYPTLGVTYYDRRSKREPVLSGGGPPRRVESFRHIRTNLRFLGATSPVAVLAVTSSTESEGKSTTSANLAIAIAASGRRVLLVDADLRRPQIAGYLDLEGAAGLTNVLVDGVGPEDVTQTWGEDGLDVITTGPTPPNPSELLGSEAMEKLLLDLRERYDVIIFDTPALLPVTDAAVLASQVDGAIVVVRWGVTSLEKLTATLGILEGVGARVLGTIMSMTREKSTTQSAYFDESPRGTGP